MAYVEDFNKKNPADKASWFYPLRAKYQDAGIGRMIEDPSTVKIAKLVPVNYSGQIKAMIR
ncbi:hypothetical protein P3T76_010372 [Phytophthora citrophthora]|uniref:Uncharacterized protein n=1 Tax=Phytophthora citrophthora TaxID=4793 RepID=A0AAD9LHC5_9STRA|nr:hypothetical protein P3T76_010372 [Phytophthora citrophthora]